MKALYDGIMEIFLGVATIDDVIVKKMNKVLDIMVNFNSNFFQTSKG